MYYHVSYPLTSARRLPSSELGFGGQNSVIWNEILGPWPQCLYILGITREYKYCLCISAQANRYKPQTSWPQHWGCDCRIVEASRFLGQQWTLAGIRRGSISFEGLWISGTGWLGGWESEEGVIFWHTVPSFKMCSKIVRDFSDDFSIFSLKGDCIFAVTAGGNTQWGLRGGQDWRFDTFEPKSCHRQMLPEITGVD